MKILFNKFSIAIFIVCLIAGFIIILYPVDPSIKPLPVFNTERQASNTNVEKTFFKTKINEKIDIASLFRKLVKKAVVPIVSKDNPIEIAQKVEAVDWLKFVGFIKSDDGSGLYYFKDNKAGRILKLSVGAEDGSYKLIEATNTNFIMVVAGIKYLIKR